MQTATCHASDLYSAGRNPLPAIPVKRQKILTISADSKTIKGEKQGYLTAIIYFAPATLAGGPNLCPHATAGCRELCLNTAGRGGMDNTQIARIKKTRYFLESRAEFLAQLHLEISAFIKRAKRKGLIPVVRLNGTSDIRWENFGIMQQFPEIQFYDYTKFPLSGRPNLPANYKLVFSFSEAENSLARALEWQTVGVNTAVVFHGKTLPATFHGMPVIDGDASDLRFLDSPGVVVGLRAKGKAKKSLSGFVQRVATESPAVEPTRLVGRALREYLAIRFPDYVPA